MKKSIARWFKYFLCFLIIVMPVWSMTGCSGGGGSGGGSDDGGSAPAPAPVPTAVDDTYSGGDPAQADTDENGNVVIVSEVLDATFDLTVKDENGNPVPNVEVDYTELDGVPYIVFDAPGYVPAIIYSEPEAMSNLRALNGDSYGGHVRTVAPPHSRIVFTAIAVFAIVSVLTIGAAEVSFLVHAANVQTFYISDAVLSNNDNWILYCKTMEEMLDFEYHRIMGIFDLAGIAVTFFSAGTVGSGSASLSIGISKAVMDMGQAAVLDEMIHASAHALGQTVDYFLENKLTTMVRPIEGAGLRNMWAPYRIYLEHPICIPNAQEGTLTGT